MKTYLAGPELIKAVQHRDQIGAEDLYDQYAAILFKVICCTPLDQVMAGKVLQDTFLHVWINIADHQPKNGRLLLWMAGIARSLAKNAYALHVAGDADDHSTGPGYLEIPLVCNFNLSV